MFIHEWVCTYGKEQKTNSSKRIRLVLHLVHGCTLPCLEVRHSLCPLSLSAQLFDGNNTGQ